MWPARWKTESGSRAGSPGPHSAARSLSVACVRKGRNYAYVSNETPAVTWMTVSRASWYRADPNEVYTSFPNIFPGPGQSNVSQVTSPLTCVGLSEPWRCPHAAISRSASASPGWCCGAGCQCWRWPRWPRPRRPGAAARAALPRAPRRASPARGPALRARMRPERRRVPRK